MIETVLIALAVAAVLVALVRPRDDDDEPARLESGQSHMRSPR